MLFPYFSKLMGFSELNLSLELQMSFVLVRVQCCVHKKYVVLNICRIKVCVCVRLPVYDNE
jgi:hypothetical protein